VKKVSSAWYPLCAFVLPFAVFIVATSLEEIDFLKAWYPILYGIKTAAILGVLWWGSRFYPAWSWRGIGIGLIYGLVGGIAWIILCTWNFEKDILPSILTTLGEWLGLPSLRDWLKPGSRLGHNPFSDMPPAAAWSFTVVRLIGLVIAVPIMEELFWKGFLNRFLIAEDWQNVRWGKFTPMSFAIVTIAFVAVHTEWTAALAWGVGINLVFLYTRNLWACIVAHAASNAVLGYYILVYEQWQLW
jgi:membrane protease YdiL (CAAX protease family)